MYALTNLERWTKKYESRIEDENYLIYAAPEFLKHLDPLKTNPNIEIKEMPKIPPGAEPKIKIKMKRKSKANAESDQEPEKITKSRKNSKKATNELNSEPK